MMEQLSLNDQNTYNIFKEILKTISSFYAEEDKDITVSFEESETAFCSSEGKINLPPTLLKEFFDNNLPKFCVFYHELGHALYSDPMFKLIDKWKNLVSTITNCPYKIDYLHLINWIEDYYIESKLLKEYPYLTDILKCLRLLPVKCDILKKEYAFNYYYDKRDVSPSLNVNEKIQFKKYIDDLLMLRDKPDFGKGVLSMISTNNTNTRYTKTIKEFYTWCINHGIFPKNLPLPPLTSPVNIIQITTPNGAPVPPSSIYVQNNVQTQNVPQNNSNICNNSISSTTNTNDIDNNNCVDSNSKIGSHSDHSHQIGKMKIKQVFPELDLSTPIFTEMLRVEQEYFKRTVTSYKQDTQHNSMYGLFTVDYRETSLINKPIIPNFFNHNRLEDRVLFKESGKTFTNISIYRDISGSTTDKERFKLINEVCSYLYKNIPIDKHFYLYSSGKISILETEYIDWSNYYDIPKEYKNDPIFQQMTGGTNSDAVADVIATQLDDKWLNIIITDGDLWALFNRKNIESLLHNIAIIDVSDGYILYNKEFKKLINPNHYIKIESENDIPMIADTLINFKED